MTVLIFPENPVNGQIYPPQPIPNVHQYTWSSESNTWELVPSEGGGGASVETFTYTTSSLDSEEIENFELAVGKLYQILSITTDFPSWIRVFGNDSGRDLDIRTTPSLPFPSPGTGFFAEVVTTPLNLSVFMSPMPSVQQEGGETFLSIKNMDSTAREITITIQAAILIP